MKKLLEILGIVETNYSAAEWAWRIIVFLVVATGGTTSGFLAKSSEWFKAGGSIAWVGVGLTVMLIFSFVVYLIQTASLKSAQAEYTRSMASKNSTINPLLSSFENQIIKIEDLRLPGQQLHANKVFKKCQFVGPGAIALLGGTYHRDNFFECGDIVVLPNKVLLTGIVVLQNCIVEDCEFHRVTIFTPEQMGREFKSKMNANVAGL